MSADDGFLTRWSRRKRSAAARKRDPAAPKSLTPSAESKAGEAIVEPLSLPPIEALDAASDITPFLAPGVPAELTRRALRRVWTTDPAIRDFVGLSENAWDFNAPGGVPGFGALTQEDIRRLLDKLTGAPVAADPPPDPSGPVAPEPAPIPEIAETEPETRFVAAEHKSDQQQSRTPVSVRRHGSALPR